MQECNGDILASSAQVIVQQCNCITLKSLGLASAIEQRFGISPYADRVGQGNLANAATSATVGTIQLYSTTGPMIACLFAQYAPGPCWKRYPVYEKVKAERGIEESAALREQWFAQCLDQLAMEMTARGLVHVALPHGIGCGLAGGNWSRYKAMIQHWSALHPTFRVDLVKL